MLVLEKNSITEEIEALVVEHGSERSALMPILQSVQSKHRYIPDFAQQEIARLLDIHPVEVYSVISFYSFLHSEPQGRNIVRLCKTIVCDLAGKTEVEKAVMRELKINVGETTKDKKVTLEHTNCLGMCDQGPAMMVNDKIFTKLTPEKAVEILKSIK
jgi:NADH-quinone oxidoreductase E subunit